MAVVELGDYAADKRQRMRSLTGSLRHLLIRGIDFLSSVSERALCVRFDCHQHALSIFINLCCVCVCVFKYSALCVCVCVSSLCTGASSCSLYLAAQALLRGC